MIIELKSMLPKTDITDGRILLLLLIMTCPSLIHDNNKSFHGGAELVAPILRSVWRFAILAAIDNARGDVTDNSIADRHLGKGRNKLRATMARIQLPGISSRNLSQAA